MYKKVAITLAGLFVITAIAGGVVLVRRRGTLRTRSEAIYSKAETSFNKGEYSLGTALLEANRKVLFPWFSWSDKWNKLEVDCAEFGNNRLKVLSMFYKVPELIRGSEQCSLWVCRYLLSTTKYKEFDDLRLSWVNKETKKHLWFNLDYDRLVASEDYEQAREFLFSSKFEGANDSSRLIRCAILTSQTDLRDALEYLSQAEKVAPKDPDIHLFRAQILEAVKDNKGAEFHYIAASCASNQSPFYRSRLGDFYRRRGQVLKAIKIWGKGSEKIRPSYLSRKIHFWNKVVTGIRFAGSEKEKIGVNATMSQYINGLEYSKFWDEKAFRESGLSLQAVRKSQELLWLRKIGYMVAGDDENLRRCLLDNAFEGSSFSDNILGSLMLINSYRRNDIFVRGNRGNGPTSSKPRVRHSFFDDLSKSEYKFALGEEDFISPELGKFIQGPYAYSACFLAGGWFNVALQLSGYKEGTVLSDFPSLLPLWYRYGIVQAVNQVFGPERALSFIGNKPMADRELSLVQGELLLATQKVDEGKKILMALTQKDDGVSYRSMFICANLLASEGAHIESTNLILTNSMFASSDTGLKLLARIHHAGGREADAVNCYKKMKENSAEKLGYLAFYANKTGAKSQSNELTRKLSRDYGTDLATRRYLLRSQVKNSPAKSKGL